MELAIVRKAVKFLGRGQAPPKRLYPVIDELADAGIPVDRCCRILGVARQNYYKHKRTPTTPARLRRVVTADDLVNRKFHRCTPTNSGSPTSRSIRRGKARSSAPR